MGREDKGLYLVSTEGTEEAEGGREGGREGRSMRRDAPVVVILVFLLEAEGAVALEATGAAATMLG
jgi:hypothetical protein